MKTNLFKYAIICGVLGFSTSNSEAKFMQVFDSASYAKQLQQYTQEIKMLNNLVEQTQSAANLLNKFKEYSQDFLRMAGFDDTGGLWNLYENAKDAYKASSSLYNTIDNGWGNTVDNVQSGLNWQFLADIFKGNASNADNRMGLDSETSTTSVGTAVKAFSSKLNNTFLEKAKERAEQANKAKEENSKAATQAEAYVNNANRIVEQTEAINEQTGLLAANAEANRITREEQAQEKSMIGSASSASTANQAAQVQPLELE